MLNDNNRVYLLIYFVYLTAQEQPASLLSMNCRLYEPAYWSFYDELTGYKTKCATELYTDPARSLCHHFGICQVSEDCLTLISEINLKISIENIIQIRTSYDQNLNIELLDSLNRWKPLKITFSTISTFKTVYIRFHNDIQGNKAKEASDLLHRSNLFYPS